MYFSSLLTVVSEDEDISDYPDDFEEAEDNDLAEVVSYARDAMNGVSENEAFDVGQELKDAGGFSVTMKVLKEKYMGKHAHFHILSRFFFLKHLIVLFSPPCVLIVFYFSDEFNKLLPIEFYIITSRFQWYM